MAIIELQLGEETIALEEGKVYNVGRSGHGADIEITDKMASRKHAAVEVRASELFIQDLGSSNGTVINGQTIEPLKWKQVKPGDQVKIASQYMQIMAAAAQPADDLDEEMYTHFESAEAGNDPNAGPSTEFKSMIRAKGKYTIGRKSDNDLVLSDPTIGRYHAEILYEDGHFWLKDLESLNGTFLNGNKVRGKVALRDDDTIIIALDAITLTEGWVDLRTQKAAISAKNIFKQYPNKKIGLQPLSVDIPYSNFVALMGPSGCGKSTLLKCLNGDNPASDGEVLIHGLPLRKNFNLLKRKIGYVPQDDIIHKDLSVYKTLYYAAKLRLPDDTTRQEIDRRINKVIDSLSLDQDKEKDIREVKVRDLSGGQRKRVSIAVELLVEPTILFLDEPTSPLDPESIDSFLKSLQRLTKEGTTIIMVTHKPEDLNYVDNVIFLMVKGYMTYFGKATNLVSHFGVDDIVKVYAKLSDKSKVDEHIDQYYQKSRDTNSAPPDGSGVKKDKRESWFLQLFWLFSRYLNIKTSDRGNITLLLSQPIIIAGLICMIFDEMQVGVLFLTAISAIWFGVSNSAKEIVGELPIYRRERMFNLNIHTYILSKWIVLSMIAMVQTLIFVTIIYIKFKNSTIEGFENVYLQSFEYSAAYMFFIAFSASLIGLWLSSYFDTTEKVMTVVPIALMPQIMLSGVITKIDNVLIEVFSFFTLGRWGTEGLARVQDHASGGAMSENLQSILLFSAQTDSYSPMGALAFLDYYNEEYNLIGTMFNSAEANLFIVLALDVLLYFAIYISLKRKDSI